jgi:hypothetical protein
MGVQMTFGKHAGKAVDVLDDGYLRWIVTKCTNCDPRIREAAEEELYLRKQWAKPAKRVRRQAANRTQASMAPEQLAEAAARMVDGTPAAALFGDVTRILFDVQATCGDDGHDLDTSRDLESLAARLQVIRSSLIDVARTVKRLRARRPAAADATHATAG